MIRPIGFKSIASEGRHVHSTTLRDLPARARFAAVLINAGGVIGDRQSQRADPHAGNSERCVIHTKGGA